MAAEAEPHESVSPAPASFVLINIAPLYLINKDIFVSLKIFLALKISERAERSQE